MSYEYEDELERMRNRNGLPKNGNRISSTVTNRNLRSEKSAVPEP